MEPKNNEEIEIDLRELFIVLWDKAVIIILSAVALGLIAYAVSRFAITPVYDSTTKIYILNQQDSSTVTASDLQTGTQLTKDYEEMITGRSVIEQVCEELNLDMTYEEAVEKVTVSTQTDTRIIAITVRDADPYKAKVVADKIREVAAVKIADVMDIESVKTVEEANIPDAPAGPNVMKNTMIGVLLGLILSMGIVIVIYLTNDKIKTPEDIEKYLGLSVLGSIPVDESLAELTNAENRRKKRKAKGNNK